MSRLALGTAQFGLNYGVANNSGKVSRVEAKAILNLARENGITLLDTAISYGDSEKTLGQIGTHDLNIMTKLPSLPSDEASAYEWVRQQVQHSLAALNVGSLHGLLLHRPNQILGKNGDEIYRGLQSLKVDGLVDKIGLSIYSPDELTNIIESYRFDIVQSPFNLVDRRLESSGWMKRLKDLDIDIHARSTFLQGLLLMNESDIPARFYPWMALLRKWHLWLESTGYTKLQACTAFPLGYPQIDRVIIGVDSACQLAEILRATEVTITNFPDLQSSDQDFINPVNWNDS